MARRSWTAAAALLALSAAAAWHWGPGLWPVLAMPVVRVLLLTACVLGLGGMAALLGRHNPLPAPPT